MLVSKSGSPSHSTHPLQDRPPPQRDNTVTDTVKETENIVTEIETVITGTLVTVTTRKTIGTATEMLAVAVVEVGTRGRLSPPPRPVTTPTLAELVAVDVTNTTGTGRETMIVEIEMGIVEEGGARIVIAITLPLATCTIPTGNIRKGEGGTAAVAMAMEAGRREEDMEAIEVVVGGSVGVDTEEETGADSLSLEVGVQCLVTTTTPLSSLPYPMIIHTPLLGSILPIKKHLVARRWSTNMLKTNTNNGHLY